MFPIPLFSFLLLIPQLFVISKKNCREKVYIICNELWRIVRYLQNTNLITSGQIKRKLAKLNNTLIQKLSFHSFSLQNLQIENLSWDLLLM